MNSDRQQIPTWILVAAIAGGVLLLRGGGESSFLAGLQSALSSFNFFTSAPIKEPGFRVLIVAEPSSPEFTALPEARKAIFTSTIIREYTNRKCVKDEKGRPEFRVLDPDQEVEGLSEIWKKALARERKSLPWIVVSNGRSGFEGPLPASVEEALVLLKKYGGE